MIEQSNAAMHEITQHNALELVTHYVPSADNPADIWIRIAEGKNPTFRMADFSLPIDMMEWIQNHFKERIVLIGDWMATEMNLVAKSFISETPTRLAAGVNSFPSNLANHSSGWLYRPNLKIPDVTQKLLSETTFCCLLVVPSTYRKF